MIGVVLKRFVSTASAKFGVASIYGKLQNEFGPLVASLGEAAGAPRGGDSAAVELGGSYPTRPALTPQHRLYQKQGAAPTSEMFRVTRCSEW